MMETSSNALRLHATFTLSGIWAQDDFKPTELIFNSFLNKNISMWVKQWAKFNFMKPYI